MDDLGKYLKAERKKQKVSVDEIASHTKIPVRFIQAIEANQFDQIPNAVSAKGFLRGYAQFLGLDTAEISEAFDEELRSTTKGSSEQDEILSHLQVKRPSRLPFPRRVIFLVGGVVLLLLVFVGLLPEQKNSLRTPSPPPILEEQITTREDKPAGDEEFVEKMQITETSPTAEETAAVPLDETAIQENTEVESEKVLTAIKVRPEEAEEPASPSENEPPPVSPAEEPSMHLLYVEAIEPTWVQVEIDGDEIREALLQPNDSVRWKAKEKFLLKVGNAGGVKVRLNGNELGPLGPSGEVVEKEIIGVTEASE